MSKFIYIQMTIDSIQKDSYVRKDSIYSFSLIDQENSIFKIDCLGHSFYGKICRDVWDEECENLVKEVIKTEEEVLQLLK